MTILDDINNNHKTMEQSFKEYMDKVCSSKESAQQFLIDLGTHNPDGSLTEDYK